MKYIAFEGPAHQEIILFSTSRDHSYIARIMGIEEKDLLGAGSVYYDAKDVPDQPPQCGGHSTTLKIKSRGEEDTILLHRMLSR